MQTNKEHWIDETMNSADAIQSLSVSSQLRSRLEAIPKTVEILDVKIPFRSVVLVAASILVLIAFNIFSIRSSQSEKVSKQNEVYNSYFSYLNEL